MAVSHDGKQWTKPSLGITEFNHSTSNNSAYTSSLQPILQLSERGCAVVMGGNGTGKSVSPGQVFVDTNPATKPEHKFKLNVLRSGAKRGAYV